MLKNVDKIVYTKVGSGPHLCFLHGFCENRSIWKDLVDALSNAYTILNIDLLGFGDSSTQSFETLDDQVEAVRRVLSYENANRCILMGHSMGGYIAAAYAQKYGADLRAVGFIHSTASADSESKKENRIKAINHIKAYGTDEYFKRFVATLVTTHNLPKLQSQLWEMVSSTKKSPILSGLNAMRMRPDYKDVLKTFNKPVLFMRGEEDMHYSENEITNQVALSTASQYSVLRGVAHLGLLEDKTQTEKEVRKFLVFVDSFYST